MIIKGLAMAVTAAVLLAGNLAADLPNESITTEPTWEAAAPYADLVLNKYKGLEISAAILPRNAILPGMTVPVSIVVTNRGNQSVTYVHGSGSFTTPEAVHLDVNGLQPILPEDHLGIALMNYVVKDLSPGQSLTFTINVKVIEPNENFNNYTHDLFFNKQVYIGDLSMKDLFSMYGELTPASPGAYEGVATFVYYYADGPQDTNVWGNGNGYIQAPITIYVN